MDDVALAGMWPSPKAEVVGNQLELLRSRNFSGESLSKEGFLKEPINMAHAFSICWRHEGHSP